MANASERSLKRKTREVMACPLNQKHHVAPERPQAQTSISQFVRALCLTWPRQAGSVPVSCGQGFRTRWQRSFGIPGRGSVRTVACRINSKGRLRHGLWFQFSNPQRGAREARQRWQVRTFCPTIQQFAFAAVDLPHPFSSHARSSWPACSSESGWIGVG